MSYSPLTTAAVYRDVRDILTREGWAAGWRSGLLNLRAAILMAAGGDSALYAETCFAWRDIVGDGVMSWEGGTHADKPRPRTQEEVINMLDKVIATLEAQCL